jgi:hypothetical protein
MQFARRARYENPVAVTDFLPRDLSAWLTARAALALVEEAVPA